MRLIHLSDLHIGKRVNEFSMIEDQRFILKKITDIVKMHKPDGVIIAGDVYDKPVPSAEAVSLLDDFLTELSGLKVPVFIISGNHDSPERIAFGAKLMRAGGIYVSQPFKDTPEKFTLSDEYGEVNIYLLPFIKPINVRSAYEEAEIRDYNDALGVVTENMQVDESARNVLVCHQFITGARRCDSEEISVGGLDDVDYRLFDKFDYVALGHIHSPQRVGRDTVRYCGTPLKYSFSECGDKKSVTVVEIGEKGDVKIGVEPLVPRLDMVEIKGKFDEVIAGGDKNYVHITLTDEQDVIDAAAKLRTRYPNLMRLDYDNRRTNAAQTEMTGDMPVKSPFDLFAEFYDKQNGMELDDEQEKFVKSIIEQVWGDER